MIRGTKKADAGHAKHPFGNSKGIENPISETKSARNSIGRPRLARCRVFLHQPVNFPFVLMADGKAQRIIKPLYLAQGDSTKILNHGGQWVDRVRRLRKRHALPNDVLFPVTAPQINSKAYDAFAEIRDDLRSVNVQIAPANDEDQILRFAAI